MIPADDRPVAPRVRRADGPPEVASHLVACEGCGADCWESSGDGSGELRVLLGGRVLCYGHCITLDDIVGEPDAEVWVP